MAGNAFSRLDTCWSAALADNSAERVHKLRVGLRQLRVVLALIRKMLAADQFADARAALAALAKTAGRQRDLDVVTDEIVKPLMREHQRPEIGILIEVLEREREQVRGAFAGELRSPETEALRLRLGDLPAELIEAKFVDDEDAPVGAFAHRQLRKRWRKLERHGARFKELDAEGLHEMRKSLKRLRYTFGHFAGFEDKKRSLQFTKQMQRLQTTFGYFNDVQCAEKLTRLHELPVSPDLARGAGFVLGVHSERAQHAHKKILKQWRKLVATEIGRDLAAE